MPEVRHGTYASPAELRARAHLSDLFKDLCVCTEFSRVRASTNTQTLFKLSVILPPGSWSWMWLYGTPMGIFWTPSAPASSASSEHTRTLQPRSQSALRRNRFSFHFQLMFCRRTLRMKPQGASRMFKHQRECL